MLNLQGNIASIPICLEHITGTTTQTLDSWTIVEKYIAMFVVRAAAATIWVNTALPPTAMCALGYFAHMIICKTESNRALTSNNTYWYSISIKIIVTQSLMVQVVSAHFWVVTLLGKDIVTRRGMKYALAHKFSSGTNRNTIIRVLQWAKRNKKLSYPYISLPKNGVLKELTVHLTCLRLWFPCLLKQSSSNE